MTRIVLATRAPRHAEMADDDLIWLDARRRTISRGGLIVRLGRLQWTLAAALVVRGERWITVAEIAEHLYGDLEDGGPDEATSIIRLMIHRLRGRERNQRAQNLVGILTIDAWGMKDSLGYRAIVTPIAEREAA